jgi:DNA invertase Pin-like site-specific DNA recombinase
VIAAVYARKSTDQSAAADEGEERRPTDRPREVLRRAKRLDLTESCIFVDDGVSGAELESTSPRPGRCSRRC